MRHKIVSQFAATEISDPGQTSSGKLSHSCEPVAHRGRFLALSTGRIAPPALRYGPPTMRLTFKPDIAHGSHRQRALSAGTQHPDKAGGVSRSNTGRSKGFGPSPAQPTAIVARRLDPLLGPAVYRG